MDISNVSYKFAYQSNFTTMNYITTDEGNVVYAIGSDGSDIRLKAEWPGAIKKINKMFDNDVRELDAECLIIEHFKVHHPGYEWIASRLMQLSKYYEKVTV